LTELPPPAAHHGEDPAAACVYRIGTLADVPRVIQLLRPFVTQRKLLKRTRAEMDALVPSGYLAEINGRLIGFAAVEIYSRKLAEIQCLAVDAQCQGRGIGSELVRRCVELARQRGVMEVMAISSSESFLQHLGFAYSLPDQKRALFCQLRSRDEMFASQDDDEDDEEDDEVDRQDADEQDDEQHR
jgi:amino-acid N-acetyltransferase